MGLKDFLFEAIDNDGVVISVYLARHHEFWSTGESLGQLEKVECLR
jgi:hypothetical protein